MDIQLLITESEQLEKIASKIQDGERVGLSNDLITAFIARYQHWYAQCLAILPDDLKSGFREEYQGSLLKPSIRGFLKNPIKPSVIDRSNLKVAAIYSYWQNPFDTFFKNPLMSQKQILIEASKRRAIDKIQQMMPLNELDEEIDIIRQIIAKQKKNQHTLELQAADFGAHPPLHIINQIDRIRESVRLLERKAEIVRLTKESLKSLETFKGYLVNDETKSDETVMQLLKPATLKFISALEQNLKWLKQEYNKL